MAWIIISGILTCGILPLMAAFGYGINLIFAIWFEVAWTYWQCVGVGFVFVCFAGVRFKFFPISFNIKKTEKDIKG